jgi:hypothetical protein
MSHTLRWRAALVATVALAAVTGGITPPAVAAREGPRQHTIEYTLRTTLQVGTPLCDAAQHCLFPYAAPAIEWSGDFAGAGLESGSSMLGGARGTYGSEIRIFVGNLVPCGTGTLLMASSGVTGADAHGTGSWRIVPGFGTDDLKGVTGSGTSVNNSSQDALSPVTTAKGKVRC